jgi:S-adenosylmethionine:tRNA ribosyltransferase-isomerase
MVARRAAGAVEHACFRDLPEFLEPGDLLVINNSATVPAAVPARTGGGEEFELRFAGPMEPSPGSVEAAEMRGDRWVVELRADGGARPHLDARVGERLALPAGAEAVIVGPHAGSRRMWVARIAATEPVPEYLWRYGHPIRYGYVSADWPLDAYQTVYALEPGSAEMPSAGRPLSGDLVAALVARGVMLAPITLHTGLSSPEWGEAPQAERYAVSGQTSRLVNAVRGWGGRVIAVGTTVVRALETVATPDGLLPGRGWTSIEITPERRVIAVDGLLTGWHEPEASHLQMLEAIAGPALLGRAYRAALDRGYLWHEFGDSHLILP